MEKWDEFTQTTWGLNINLKTLIDVFVRTVSIAGIEVLIDYVAQNWNDRRSWALLQTEVILKRHLLWIIG